MSNKNNSYNWNYKIYTKMLKNQLIVTHPNSQLANRQEVRSFSSGNRSQRNCETRAESHRIFKDLLNDFQKSDAGKLSNFMSYWTQRANQNILFQTQRGSNPSILNIPNLKSGAKTYLPLTQRNHIPLETQQVNAMGKRSLAKINSMTK